MNTRASLQRVLFAAGALLASFACAQTARPAPAAPAAAPVEAVVNTPPVPVHLWVDKDSRDVALVGRTDEAVLLAGASAGVPAARLELAKITRAEFTFDFDRFEVAKAVRRNDWPAAVRLLNPVLKPVLPYLALPENNAADAALELGTYMMRAAERTTRGATNDAQRELAGKQYDAAYEIFKECARATWSSVGQMGVLKGCRCLLALNKPKTAQRYVNDIAEPTPGDAAYGHYWLIRGELEYRAGHYREAMDAVLKSVCFEDKDVETFPDALLLSARCYEELLEPYRARDVDYEVARLFPHTDWAAVAVERLHAIMDKGLTLNKETSPIENVFFKTGDDVNKLAEQLFKDLEKPPVEEEEEDSTSTKPKPATVEPEEAATPPGKPPPAAQPAVQPAPPPQPAPPTPAPPKAGTKTGTKNSPKKGTGNN